MSYFAEKSNQPVIFIGLGGTGRDAIIAIKEKFIDRLNRDVQGNTQCRTAYIVIDSEHNYYVPKQLISADEYIDISSAYAGSIILDQRRRMLNEQVYGWLNPELGKKFISNGTSGIRQMGRLNLFMHVVEIKRRFMAALDKVTSHKIAEQDFTAQINVVICAGLGGGTGSGTLLDIAYLVQNWTETSGLCIKTFGFFVMPNVYFANFLNIDSQKKMMKVNAYACLKRS